jgi:hypothetical protein
MNELQKVTDKTNHKKLYNLPWPGIKLIILVVTGTDYTGKCKSNYQTTTITIGPSFSKCLLWYSAYSCKNKMVKYLIKMKHLYLISEVQILSTISINNFTNLNPITYIITWKDCVDINIIKKISCPKKGKNVSIGHQCPSFHLQLNQNGENTKVWNRTWPSFYGPLSCV